MRLAPVILAALVGLSGYYGLKVGRHEADARHALLPPPPAPGSAAMEEDVRVYQATRHLAGSSRWEQAARDARLNDAQTIRAFIAAGHVRLTDAQEQALATRLEALQQRARQAMMAEKDLWQRRRPYVDYGGPSCVIDHRRFIPSWSYPSGHTVRGYVIALTLAQLFPDHKPALLAKAHDFAESRVICGMHWLSDTKAGEVFARKLVGAGE